MVIATLGLLPLSGYAQSESTVDVTYLVLTETNGTVSKFALSYAPEITVQDSNLVVACQGDELVVALTNVRDYSFVVEQQVTGISHISIGDDGKPSNEPTVSFRDATISGLRAGSRIAIYNMSGALVSQFNANEQGSASIDLSSLPKGVYVIYTPSKSFKIINR